MESLQKDAVSVDVSARLRELREAQGVSMRTLASRSGLSANALSMIERGKTSPSVSTLYKLANALGVSITAFFVLENEKKQVVFMKHNERTRLSFTRGVFEALGGEQFTERVEPFMLSMDSGATSGPHEMIHSGHEFVYCLRGQLEYTVEKQTYRLEPGDSLLFASKLRHRWKNPANMLTNALILISGFAEGEEPHTMHWKK